jgi:hypothetical protein
MATRALLVVTLGVCQLSRFGAAFVAPHGTLVRSGTAHGGRCCGRAGAAALHMAAKGKGKKPAVTFKGFGAVPAKLETRVPESDTELCECKSGKSYGECCKPFHAGERWPETPLQLMRSRFVCAARAAAFQLCTSHLAPGCCCLAATVG